MTKSRSNQQQRYLPVMQENRDITLATLESLISEMFNQVEPAFLDFIDRADTNQSQFQFVDAITIVTANRELVEQTFTEEISRGFTEFSKQHCITYDSPILEPRTDSQSNLELVDDNEFSQQISLLNMIERTRSDCFQELHALRQRLSMINGGKILEEKDIPAGPIHIALAIQKASAEFGFETSILLIIHALFDKFVMRKLGGLYKEINAKLADAGIFPNLKFEAPKNPNKPEETVGESDNNEDDPVDAPLPEQPRQPYQHQRRGQPRQPGTGPGQPSTPSQQGSTGSMEGMPLGEELFETIRSLLTSRRSEDPRYAQHPDFNPNAPARQMVDTPALVSGIHDLQSMQSASFAPSGIDTGDRPVSVVVNEQDLNNVRERLTEEREQLFQTIDRNTIPSADLDTIELVGMLFEHVLNEEALPNIAKALISHLHTPYLKVAIVDHRFLIDTQHIARKLLNLMVQAGMQWIQEDDLRRGIYYSMKECVNLILSDFKEDVAVFDTAYEKLTTKIKDLEQKAKVVEVRAQEAAQGRERLENARDRGERVIQKQIDGRRFPPAVERFLNRAWLDKMILMLLRDPNIEGSSEWKEVIRVIDDIIKACESRQKPELKTQLKTLIPDLQQRIEQGLESMGDYHQPDLQALFDLLTSYVNTNISAANTPENEQESENQTAWQKPKTQLPSKPLSNKEKAMVEQLRKLKFGTLFEIEDKKGKTHRLKLSWFSPVTRKYMFVDRSGVQALVTPVDVLARQVCKGKARIMEQSDVPFMDRALDKVFSLLQKPFI
ncbi:MAG: DUF1631 domain-containing protein [Gammaproteobacteria bacterium]|nr:DUF1631 domain-containing protein [Gammaproteobacteria bacterium]